MFFGAPMLHALSLFLREPEGHRPNSAAYKMNLKRVQGLEAHDAQ